MCSGVRYPVLRDSEKLPAAGYAERPATLVEDSSSSIFSEMEEARYRAMEAVGPSLQAALAPVRTRHRSLAPVRRRAKPEATVCHRASMESRPLRRPPPHRASAGPWLRRRQFP